MPGPVGTRGVRVSKPTVMGVVVFTASVALALAALNLIDGYIAGGRLRALGLR